MSTSSTGSKSRSPSTHRCPDNPRVTPTATPVGARRRSHWRSQSRGGQPARGALYRRFDRLAYPFDGLVQRYPLGLAAGAVGQLDHAVGQGALADRDAQGDADQFDVAELDPGAFAAVVDDRLDAFGEQLLVDPFAGLDHGLVVGLGNHYGHVEWRDRHRPHDALVVVVPFDDRRHRPLDTDAVATHDDLCACAVRIEYGRVECLAVPVAELEDVADLDGPLYLQWLATAHTGLTGGDLAQVGPGSDGDVPFDVDAAQVDVVGVGAGEHVPAAAERLVGHDRQVLYADRAEAAG